MKKKATFIFTKKFSIISFLLCLFLILAVINYKFILSPLVSPEKAEPESIFPHIWKVRSIETMSLTKDRLCNQPSISYIKKWVKLAKEAGATHITYSGFYDSLSCGNAEKYAEKWEREARQVGLHIWWRQMFTEFEGIDKPVVSQCNGANKGNCRDYIALTVEEIKKHPDKYQDGDIFSVTAEPGANRIRGVTCIHEGPCVFESKSGAPDAIPEFNEWMVRAVEAAKNTFQELGVDVAVTAGGLDLFVAVGYGNPDWGCDNGQKNILYPETVEKMGGMVLDHYFDADYESMQKAIDAINHCYPAHRYPHLVFQIGEWGPLYGLDTPRQIHETMDTLSQAGSRYTAVFNYWQGGPFGQESLFAEDGESIRTTPNYDALKKQFERQRYYPIHP